MKRKITLGFKIVIIIPIALIGFCIWFCVVHSGQLNDPSWEEHTETYTSIADAEAALGEDLLLSRLLDPSNAPYEGWRQYIKAQYGADMLAKLEKERASSPFEEVILYHEIGGSSEDPQSWEEITACINYSGLASGSPEDGPQYPQVNLTIRCKEPETAEEVWMDKVKYSSMSNNGDEVFYWKETDDQGMHHFMARFVLGDRWYYLSTESPNDSWFGMKTLKRLLEWDMIYIPAGAYPD